jgi:hypothetical protein
MKDSIIFQWIIRDMNAKKPFFEEWVCPGKKGGMLEDYKVPDVENVVPFVALTKKQVIKKLAVAEKKLAKLSAEETDEFDVVKKRRTIQAANDFVGDDVTCTILGSDAAADYFKSFSSEVFTALQNLCIREVELRKDDDACAFGDSLGEAGKKVGYVYAAGNPSLGCGIAKIGATCRDSPWPRMRELSSYFPTDFYIIALIPCTNAFEVEKRVHMHFADKRVWRERTGRKTELFLVSEEVVSNYFAHVNQELLSSV